MGQLIARFLTSEHGAITTDWVVLVGGVIAVCVLSSTTYAPILSEAFTSVVASVGEAVANPIDG